MRPVESNKLLGLCGDLKSKFAGGSDDEDADGAGGGRAVEEVFDGRNKKSERFAGACSGGELGEKVQGRQSDGEQVGAI
jgi:hypothetical protein